MKISKTKFVFLFLACSFTFQFLSNSLYLDEVRLFPANGESFVGLGAHDGWRNILAIVLVPIKAILIGPLIPFIDFFRQEPDTPPPFFLIGFAIYWTILAIAIYHIVAWIKTLRK